MAILLCITLPEKFPGVPGLCNPAGYVKNLPPSLPTEIPCFVLLKNPQNPPALAILEALSAWDCFAWLIALREAYLAAALCPFPLENKKVK